MNKFGPQAQEKVRETVKEYKKGELTIGNSDKKVKSRKQAIAIGLDTARREGGKVPKKKN